MDREQQEAIFAVEVQKTLARLADEFDLNTFSVIGMLEVILLGIKHDMLSDLYEANEDEDD